MHTKRMLGTTVACLSLALPTVSVAQDILTVTNGEETKSYKFEDLLAFEQETVETTNDYVDELTTFQGPSLQSLLEASDIDRDAEIQLSAINDFTISVPAEDAFLYGVILALLRDGEEMSVRDKGPIWVIYPMDDNPELRDDLYNGRLVWQLKSIAVE
ncbi:hypothetical protein [Loktanella sp. R86503]|uniref:hypothetical protein n=1 Tax=Loktanella sp. R86503 TaxID=3093847 RepID=UPI0036DE1705